MSSNWVRRLVKFLASQIALSGLILTIASGH